MNLLLQNLRITQLSNQLRQIARTPNAALLTFNAIDVSKIREEILTMAKAIANEDSQLYSQLIRAKDILFYTNQYGQAMINIVVLGEVIFGLDYLAAKQQTQSKTPESENGMWLYIHPLIQESSKQLFLDGHYANAAEDAYIEINDRVKRLFAIVKPGCKVPDGGTVMNTVFSVNSPLIEFCDQSTETGLNKQKGYMQMLAGAMSALRNPKAHSNSEALSEEESYRRLATASMLMYAIDDAVQYSAIIEKEEIRHG